MKIKVIWVSLAAIAAISALLWTAEIPRASKEQRHVKIIRTPDGGIQPQVAVGRDGVVHLIYFKGPDNAGDVYYVRKGPCDASFSQPIRVNSVPGSAIAIGSVRGAQIAVGRRGRVHVSWLGSDAAQPRGPGNSTPMLYARINDAGTAFEPQKNVMQFAVGLDGGGSVAADQAGNVYLVWHGNPDKNGEVNRRVWVARSLDDGKTFGREVAANTDPTGACGCCGLRAFADDRGTLYILYRAAREAIHRDMYLLVSTDHGKTFKSDLVSKWELNACPMSTDFISQEGEGALIAWQTEEQVYFATVSNGGRELSDAVSAPGQGSVRKHPAVIGNSRGDILLAWTEGTGWKQGGSLAWQVYDKEGRPTAIKGSVLGLPVWDLVAAFPDQKGGFNIIY
jgi:hypothetical protein